MEPINGNNIWNPDMNILFLDATKIFNDKDRWNPMIIPRDSVGSFEILDRPTRRRRKYSGKGDTGIYFIKRYKMSTGEWVYWYIGETGDKFGHRMYMFVRTLRMSCTDGDTPHSAALCALKYRFDSDWGVPALYDIDSEYMILEGFQFCFIPFQELDFHLVDRTITQTTLYGKTKHYKSDEDLRIEFEEKCINEFKPIANQKGRDDHYRYRQHIVENNIFDRVPESSCLN